MIQMRRLTARGLATTILIGCSTVHAASFQGLGDLPGGVLASIASGVSADGAVVAGYSFNSFGPGAFRWTRTGGMQALGTASGDDFLPFAISGDGSTVVGYRAGVNALSDSAVRWSSATGIQALGDLPGRENRGHALGVSANGNTVVGWSVGESGEEAFRWTPDGGMSALDGLPAMPLGGRFTYAFGVSADGSVIVGRSDTSFGTESFRWTSSTGAVGLVDSASKYFSIIAQAISGDGSAIVGFARNNVTVQEAFRWTSADGITGLGDLPGGAFASDAYATSSDGSVVVGTSLSSSGWEAFVWTAAAGMQSLSERLTALGVDLTGWHLLSATGVSADGNTIVGSGINPSGRSEAFIVTIPAVPEPSSVLLAVLGVGALFIRIRAASPK